MTCLRLAPQQTDALPSGGWDRPEDPLDELCEMGGDSDEPELPPPDFDNAHDRITGAPGRSPSEVSMFIGKKALLNPQMLLGVPFFQAQDLQHALHQILGRTARRAATITPR